MTQAERIAEKIHDIRNYLAPSFGLTSEEIFDVTSSEGRLLVSTIECLIGREYELPDSILGVLNRLENQVGSEVTNELKTKILDYLQLKK